MEALIDAGTLRGLIEGSGGDATSRPVVLDVRWTLGATDPRGDHEAGHIPGSRYVDLETELAGPGDPSQGRHPLPDPVTFAATATGWGVGPDTHVVAYDDNGGMSAARLWWLLRWICHDRVQVLDGGLAAWRRFNGDDAIDTGSDAPAQPSPVPLTAGKPGMATVTADDIAAGTVGLLLDARAPERYRGDVEPIDPVAGHIPGAVNAPTGGNLTPDGTFLTPEALRARFEVVGVVAGAPVVAYCGSGVTAAHELLALEIAGLGEHAAMYPPSWSGWVSNETRPVERATL